MSNAALVGKRDVYKVAEATPQVLTPLKIGKQVQKSNND